MLLACQQSRGAALTPEALQLLREVLAWAPEQRPVAELLAARAERFAARCDDDDLVTFASYAVPPLEDAGSSSKLPTSTLYEGSTPLVGTGPLPASRPVWPVLAVAFGVIFGLLALILALVPWGPTEGVSSPGVPVAPVVSAAPSSPAVLEPAAQPVVAPEAAPAASLPTPAAPLAAPPDPGPAGASRAPAPAPVAAPPPATDARPASAARAVQEPAKAVEGAPAAAPVAPAAAAPRVSRAQVSVTDVSGFEVDCGGRRFSGTASVRVVDVPAGTCIVRAERSGRWYTGRASLTAPSEIRCVVQGEGLSCQ